MAEFPNGENRKPVSACSCKFADREHRISADARRRNCLRKRVGAYEGFDEAEGVDLSQGVAAEGQADGDGSDIVARLEQHLTIQVRCQQTPARHVLDIDSDAHSRPPQAVPLVLETVIRSALLYVLVASVQVRVPGPPFRILSTEARSRPGSVAR